MILRIDDIGASTKLYNQHGKKIFRFKDFPFFYFPFADFLFFKKIWPFKKWGPYEELTAKEWTDYLKTFTENGIKPIIAITACWVDKKNNLIPFPKKFPEEAALLKKAYQNDDIIIANHGLTHCIVGDHLPKMLRSNRSSHREFLPELDQEIHTNHILKSQKILENFFEKPIAIFVPPGNMWSIKTYNALKNTNIKTVISNRYMLDSDEEMDDIQFILDINYINFHDRDLKLFGKKFLKRKIEEYFEEHN